jgi:hypothetical protein
VSVFALLVLSRAMCVGQAHSEPPWSLDQVMEQIAAVRKFTPVTISPDGKRAAWVESLQER